MQRVIRRGILPVAVSAVAIAAVAPSAHAGFNIAKCAGDSIVGQGSSFQRSVQLDGWTISDRSTGGFAGSNRNLSYCLPGTTFNDVNNTISYTVSGSGAAKNAWDADGQAPYRAAGSPERYIAFDDAPSATELANMREGDPSTSADDADLRIVPVGLGAATISVHFPEGCRWRSDYDWKVNNTDFTTRFKLPNSRWEQAFEGSIATWGQLLAVSPSIPGIAAVPGSGKTNAECINTPIKRVVRSDVSGTSYNFKSWLLTIDSSQSPSWDEYAPGGMGNLDWPADSGSTAVLRGRSNSGVAAAVAATDGSIGYVDLATARGAGFTMTPASSMLTADKTFWVPVENGSGVFLDPQTQEFAFKSTAVDRGAACNRATVRNIPGGGDPTLNGDWTRTLAVNSPAGYGICLVTYLGAWDDARDAYGFGGGTEQAKARTVKDFVTYATLGTGQSLLPRTDYSKLPTSLFSIAQQGANGIGWAK